MAETLSLGATMAKCRGIFSSNASKRMKFFEPNPRLNLPNIAASTLSVDFHAGTATCIHS